MLISIFFTKAEWVLWAFYKIVVRFNYEVKIVWIEAFVSHYCVNVAHLMGENVIVHVSKVAQTFSPFTRTSFDDDRA